MIPDENYRADTAAQTDLRSKWNFENSSAAGSASAGAGEVTEATSLLQLLARVLSEEKKLRDG